MSGSTFFERHRTWIPGFIRHDFGRKFIALFLAAIVYISVMSQQSGGPTEDITDVRVDFVVPEGFVELDSKPQFVTLQVSGTRNNLRSYTKNNFSIVLPVDPQQNIVTIKPDQVNCPLGISVKKVIPDRLIVPLDKLETKTVKLIPTFSPESPAPAGYAVGKVTLAQPEVSVSGPARYLRKLNEIQTEVIPLESNTQSFSYTVEIKNPSKNFRITPNSTLINVEIIKDVETRIFSGIPVRILTSSEERNKNFSFELLSSPNVEVTVTGSKAVIELMRKDNLQAYIDISKLEKSGTYNVKVDCWSDRDDVKIKQIFPENISIKLINHNR